MRANVEFSVSTREKAMAIHYRSPGFILKKRDVGEADRIFTVFTKHFGKLELRAVSERKITSKLRGGLELFYLSDLEFIQGRMYKTLTDAVLRESYSCMRRSLMRLRIAWKIAEILDSVIQGEERDEKIWQLLLGFFEHLEDRNFPPKKLSLLFFYFFWNFFTCAGYRPIPQELATLPLSVRDVIQSCLKSPMVALETMELDPQEEQALAQASRQHLIKVFQQSL